MKPSYSSMVLLMQAGYAQYFQSTYAGKQPLAEGIFWMANLIEDRVKKENPQKRDYLLKHITELKDIADNSFKSPNGYIGTNSFDQLCGKLLMFLHD